MLARSAALSLRSSAESSHPLEQGTDPDHLYPTFVFRMLTFTEPAQTYSPRDVLLASWRRELARFGTR